MSESTTRLSCLIAALTQCARDKGWSDAEWARRAGVPKETLSRLRSRISCDFSTLLALADSADATMEARSLRSGATEDGLWPCIVDRALEARVARAAAGGDATPDRWRSLGPPFFVAGLAVMLASVTGFDRVRLIELAEALHPGASEPRVFTRWLAGTPLPPSRILPIIRSMAAHAA